MLDQPVPGDGAATQRSRWPAAGNERTAFRSFLAILIGAAVVKLLLLLIAGPSIQPDSPGYIGYADAILAGRAFHPFDFNAAGLPELAFRMAGYPLVIAGAKLLSSGNWASILVLFQDAATLLAAGLVFIVLRRAFAPLWAPCFVAILYLGSESLLWDNAILSDSLYASLFTLVLFALIGDCLGCWRLRVAGMAGLGLLWGASLLLRDDGVYFTVFPLLLIGWSACRRKRGWLAASAAFLLPVGGIVSAYVAWNAYRTGIAFFGITGTANWLRPVFDMARYGYARPFGGNDMVSVIMRGLPPDYDFPAQLKLLELLHQGCGCNAVAMDAIVFHKLVATVLQHPLAYLLVVARNLNYLGLGSLLADPLATLNQFVELGTPIGHRIIPGLSLRHLAALYRDFSGGELVLMLFATISTTVSTVLFSLFVVGIPYSVLREAQPRRAVPLPLALAGFCWLCFIGISLAFSLVHYEARHALPILPLGLTGIAYCLGGVCDHMTATRRAAACRS